MVCGEMRAAGTAAPVILFASAAFAADGDTGGPRRTGEVPGICRSAGVGVVHGGALPGFLGGHHGRFSIDPIVQGALVARGEPYPAPIRAAEACESLPA